MSRITSWFTLLTKQFPVTLSWIGLGLVLLSKRENHDWESQSPCFLANSDEFSIRRFPTLGVPQIINFNKIVQYKPSILGYSPFMDIPIFLLDLLMNYENCSWPTSFERTSSFAGNFSGLEWAIGVNDAHEAWGPYESTCVELGRCPQSTEFYWI